MSTENFICKLVSPLELKDNSINIRKGYDGCEPKDIVKRCGNNSHRFAVSINTFYPNVRGGYYVNRSLMKLIQNSLEKIGIKLVVDEVFQDSGIVPFEKDVALFVNDEYLLVEEDCNQLGSLLAWEFDAGGGSDFYSDSIIFDFLVSKIEIYDLFLEALKKELSNFNIFLKEER